MRKPLTSHKLTLVAVITAASHWSCMPRKDALKINNAAQLASTQIAAADDLQRYRAAVPNVAYPRLHQLLRDERTIWYDKKSMKPIYQDSDGDPQGIRYNFEGGQLDLAKHLFDGDKWKFPFNHTAGLAKNSPAVVANFVSLPVVDGKILPIVYSVKQRPRNGPVPEIKWNWMYPKGAIVGEIIYTTSPSGRLLAQEIRIRERFLTGWSTNVYRPFPSKAHLIERLKQLKAEDANPATVQRLLAELQTANTRNASVGNDIFRENFEASGPIDVLPNINDAALVEKLLTTTTFASNYDTAFERSGAATTQEAFSLVPADNFSGLIQVNEESCMRCHRDAGRPIANFQPSASHTPSGVTARAYGEMWGEDGIFSFHIFDDKKPGFFGSNNKDTRALRPEFATSGVVVKYDPQVHSADFYRSIPYGFSY